MSKLCICQNHFKIKKKSRASLMEEPCLVFSKIPLKFITFKDVTLMCPSEFNIISTLTLAHIYTKSKVTRLIIAPY